MRDIRKEGVIALKLWSLEKQVDDLIKENQELKKQLEEYKKWYQDMLEENSKLSQLWCDSRAKMAELENQQKEFIMWLENEIKECNAYSKYIERKLQELKPRCSGKTYIVNEIMKNETAKECYKNSLSKYKEIIGVKDEKNM